MGLAVLSLSQASVFAYAEHTAPVYDVDSLSNDSQASEELDSNSKSSLNEALRAPAEAPATMEQKIEQMEQQLANMRQSDLSNRLNGMQGEVQALRGQVEELTHQLQELRSQRDLHATGSNKDLNKDQNKDLAQQQAMTTFPRVSDEEANNAPQTPRSKNMVKTELAVLGKSATTLADRPRSPTTTASAEKRLVVPQEQPNIAEEQAVYQTAYNLIKIKKYNEAIIALQKMLAKYPSGQFAANAHYWLGELYSLTGENEQAASEFTAIIRQYPASPRVADAELKLGLINASLLKWSAAKSSFKKIINQYPGTPSARLAMEQLKLLKQSGH